MKTNLMFLLVTLVVALGLSNCVIPYVDVEVSPGWVVSDVALFCSAALGLFLDLAAVWICGVLGLFI